VCIRPSAAGDRAAGAAVKAATLRFNRPCNAKVAHGRVAEDVRNDAAGIGADEADRHAAELKDVARDRLPRRPATPLPT
jgi:hypothetical protein